MKTYERKGSKFFQYKFKLNGVCYRGSTFEIKKREADIYMHKMYCEAQASVVVDKTRKGTKAKRLTWQRMFELDYDRSRNVARNKIYREKRLKSFWIILDSFFPRFTDITRSDLNAYIKFRVGTDEDNPKITNQTIKQELGALKRGLEMAEDDGFRVKIPSRWPKLARSPNTGRGKGFVPTDDEMHGFFSHLIKNPKAYTAAIFMLMTNFRREEVWKVSQCSLRPISGKPIPGVAAMMHVPEGLRKNRKEACLPLTDVGVYAFKNLYKGKYDTKKAFETASRNSGMVRKMIPRCFRYAYASAAGPCGDQYALNLAMDHADGARGRYQEGDDPRMANVMLTVAQRYSIYLRGHT